jgi:hypothetical protein
VRKYESLIISHINGLPTPIPGIALLSFMALANNELQRYVRIEECGNPLRIISVLAGIRAEDATNTIWKLRCLTHLAL